MSGEKEWSYEEVDLLSVNESIKKAAEEYIDVGIVARYSEFDVCLPADREEYRSLNKNAVVVIVALTHKKSELPIKKVYMRYLGEEVSLQKISSEVREVKDDMVRVVFGNYREDSFYLIPMHFLVKDCELIIDWAANREGFVLQRYPIDVDFDYFKEDENQDKQDLKLNPEALKELLQREYSVFAEVNLEANGHDWLGYSTLEKSALLALIYRHLELDEEKYKVEKGVEAIDRLYNLMKDGEVGEDTDVSAVLEAPCIAMVINMIELENEELDEQ